MIDTQHIEYLLSRSSPLLTDDEALQLKEAVEHMCRLPGYLTLLEKLIEISGIVILHVPNDVYIPHELYRHAASRDWWILPMIPTNHKTPDVYLAAVKKSAYAIRDVPTEYITEEMCYIIASSENHAGAKRLIPKKFLTHDLCMAAIKTDGTAIQIVPHDIITAEMCMMAVKQNGSAFGFIPYHLQSDELCIEAVLRYNQNIRKVLWTNDPSRYELYKKLISITQNAFDYIPHPSPEMVELHKALWVI